MLALLSVLLVCLVWVVYYPALSFPFTSYDDPMYVAENPLVMEGLTPEGLGYAFTNLQGFYQPMVWLFYMAVAHFLGAAPASFHLANVVLHSANTVMVFVIANRLSNLAAPGFLLAAAFAVHPLNVESVAWVSEAKGLLAAFFGLVSTLVFLMYSQHRRLSTYIVVLLGFGASLLAKPSALLLPVLFLAWDVWGPGSAIANRRPLPTRLVDKLPLFVAAAAALGITYYAERSFGAVREDIPLANRVCNAALAIGAYLRQTVYPSNLSVFYPLQEHTSPIRAALCFLVVGMVFAPFALRGGRSRLLVLGFFLMLLPHLGLVQVGDHARADRYLYLPLIFLLALPCAACCSVFNLRPQVWWASTACAALISSLALNARSNLLHWRSDRALFTHALRATSENNFVAQTMLGTCALNSGEYDEAVARFLKAIQIVPASIIPRFNLALAYERVGKEQLAEFQYRAILEIKPDDTATLIHYADFLSGKGEPFIRRARMLARRAICTNPGSARGYNALAATYFLRGDTNRAYRVWALAGSLNTASYDK